MRNGDPFDVALDAVAGRLDGPDRRLAHEIAAGVLRTRRELDDMLAPRVTHSWTRVAPDLRDLLRIGAYQLVKLDRVPPHAAVSDTVELSKQEHGEKSGRFVNAVLRRVTREHAALDQGAPSADGHADPASAGALAQRYSHPAWLVDRWVARFGAGRTEDLLESNNRRPAVHVRPVRWTSSALADAWRRADVDFTHTDHGRFTVRGSRIQDLPGYADGGFIVQDPAQALVLDYAAIAEGAVVWDACAAPGGKAAIIAQRARVVASDASRGRMHRLQENVRRVAPDVALVAADATAPPLAPGSADVVLLDAPCSATGTLAKHPEARWHLTASRIARHAAAQARLLDAVSDVVRVGGELVYVTCSLEHEENEAQVTGFLERSARFGRAAPDLFVFPADAGTDGAFAARLTRTV